MDCMKMISLKDILPNPNQPRKLFDAKGITELAASISQVGLLSPLLVKKGKEGYFIIAGERRWRACRLCNIDKVPCIVCSYDEEKTALASIVENIQRRDLNPIEQAFALKGLMDGFSLTQAQAAEKIGKTQSAVANKLRLLSLSGEVQKLIVREGLTERHARELLRLPLNKQLDAAKYIVKHSLNVEKTALYIDRLLKPTSGKHIFVLKDLRLFSNSLNKSVSFLRSAGINAKSEKEEDEDFIRYLITIPKNKSIG